MPTPVSAARQCLTDEAARALDDAVAVARRRNHAQTTSLHAVSALLALPSSMLRDACARARSCSYSPRLQFRALELSVGVSLDRLPTSKNIEEEPPVSNSLMAAIKRSQANQRRHPESFHFLQMHIQQQQQQQAASFLKVELKHFILSMLDDPIVSRVFGEAGFRSSDIKIALLQRPVAQASLFSRSPPIFLCNLTGSETRLGFNFPFMGGCGYEDLDENCRRIWEVLLRKTRRNPLLMGVYARSALRSLTESVQRGRGGVLPTELAGLNIICIEKEIAEFLVEGGSEEKMGLKFKDLSGMVERCSGPGIAVNFGELEAFVGDRLSVAAVSFVVTQLTSLLKIHGGKFWLVGVAGTSNAYSKFIALFPSIEKDWDLHVLTMTSATPSMEGPYSKSSLMGSYLPFGGFLSAPSEFKGPVICTNESFTCCHMCNEKYEQEVADVLKVGPASLTSGCSTSMPWLQKVKADTEKGLDVAKTDEEKTSWNAKILGLQKKWSDICQSLHHTQPLPEFGVSQMKSQVQSLEGFRFGSGLKESSCKDPSLYEIQCPNENPFMPKELQSIFPSKQILPFPVSSDTVSNKSGSEQVGEVLKIQRTGMQIPWFAPSPMTNMSMLECTSASSLTSVTTDLGLGTLYSSIAQEPNTPNVRDQKEHLHRWSDSLSTDFDALNESTSHQIAQSSSCSGPNLEGKFDSVDFKSLNQLLTERVGWQHEAIYAINRSLSPHRSDAGKPLGSHARADIWLAFLGPDRVGKKKIASALAEALFGNIESLISLDLTSQYRDYPSNLIIEQSHGHDVLRRKTVVDYVAWELSKKPHSVVFLENVDKADFLVQASLFQAIRTGKFRDSHGREISVNNAIFVVTSTFSKGNNSFLLKKDPAMFSEERILQAKRCQMQLLLEHVSEEAKGSGSTNVKVAPRKETSKVTFESKRKPVESSDSKEQASPSKIQKQVLESTRSCLDLNMPLEEVEEVINCNGCESEALDKNSESWLNDLCGQIDGTVAFKPFNFDALAEKILKSISIRFQRTFGLEVSLEIAYEVMLQILAAAWLSDKKNALEDWLEHVLGRTFSEAQQKYQPADQHVMKLVTGEGIFVEEQALGVCLPARINLN